MKVIVTNKSELALSDLSRDYTFDITDDEGNILLGSQTRRCRPSTVRDELAAIVNEYQAAFEDENDVEIGTEI